MRRPLIIAALLPLGAGVAASCGGKEAQLTEIVVGIDTDLRVPSDVDRVEVVVTDDRDNRLTFGRGADDPLVGDSLPLTIGLSSNDARAITIETTFSKGKQTVLSRTVVAKFVESETRFLPITLCEACRDRSCPSSCGPKGCVDAEVLELLPWTGNLPDRETCDGRNGPKNDAGDAGEDGAAGEDAGCPKLTPTRAFNASNPAYPSACNVDNALVSDDKPAGLDYAMGPQGDIGQAFIKHDGRDVAGCVGVDFGRVGPIGPIVVRARAVRDNRSACSSPNCKNTQVNSHCDRCCMICSNTENQDDSTVPTCELGGSIVVFAGTQEGTYTTVGSKSFLSRDFDDYRFDYANDAQFVVVCRSTDGPAAADVDLDAVWAEPPCP